MSTCAIDAAKAANTLLVFSGDNLQALLEVMTDYLTLPDEHRDSNSDEDDVPNNGQAQLQGRTKINTKLATIIILKVKLLHTVQK